VFDKKTGPLLFPHIFALIAMNCK